MAFNWAAVASSAMSGGGGIIKPVMNLLYNNKEAKRQREWNEMMYARETNVNRANSLTEYERSLNYAAQMQAMKSAGLNPYLISGQPVNVNGTNSAKVMPYQQPDGSPIMSMGGNLLSALLIDSQRKNLDADTEKKKVDTDTQTFELQMKQAFEPIERYLGTKQTQALTANAIETRNNLIATRNLVEQEMTTEIHKTTLAKYQTELARIDVAYAEAMAELKKEALTIGNRESQKRIESLAQQIVNMNKQLEVMTAEIQSKQFGNVESWERSRTEKEMRPYRKVQSASETMKNVGGTILDYVNPTKYLKHLPMGNR